MDMESIAVATSNAVEEVMGNITNIVSEAVSSATKGEDGFSPTVEVSAITGGHTVSITDANGEKSFDVMDGVDGETQNMDMYYTTTQTNELLASKADASDIPKKVSDLTNDSGFIQATVSTLANYYTKSETYTKQEIVELVSKYTSIYVCSDDEAADGVPNISSPSDTTIYWVANDNGTYTQYIRNNDAWISTGTTGVDLSNYVSTGTLNTTLSSYVTSTALETALNGYALVEHTHDGLTHTNRTTLDKFSEDASGNLLYNNKKVGGSGGGGNTTLERNDW